ncbi:hypothetical protein A1704_12265 [Chryseobacterium cucumeris]|uniref:response regulator receiver domain n=1 Tax=Chryseobacterium cucumeris TaxID=1813611 RepID=UPI0007885FE9|nr:response regulator receiver domain [Chryseobacterium cucumeris]KYH05861.1 hypothetical protein A1704_12265 [Chryseobacterium cucumeris]
MYSQTAFNILNSSINSAVFIDEKAKDFFSATSIDSDIVEEKLSVDLFKTFKENGKSLAVHKFEVSNLKDNNTLDYLFKGKDLILLDWELAGLSGQDYSLNLLNRAISAPYINFCCIYSSSKQFDEIPLFLDAYFSGLNKQDFETIRDTFETLEPHEILSFWNNTTKSYEDFFEENLIEIDKFPIQRMQNRPPDLLLRYIYISLNIERYIIPYESLNEHEVLNVGDGSFMINNTFVLTLKKEFETDSDYKKLLKRISDIIIKNKGSFFQLLGLEMQAIFNSNERFIDETILKSSTEALFQFRNHIKNDKTFGIIIKKLLLEQATLKLRTAKLELLNSEFLDFKSNELKDKVPNNEDLFQLNVFYNSVSVKSLHQNDIPNLNFGDVFKGLGDDYYLCITALCDCYDPSKIGNNYFFVKGKEFPDIEMALMLGDTAFISFLPNNKAIFWGHPDNPMLKSSKEYNFDENTENINVLKDQIKTLNKKIETLDKNINKLSKFLYKPYYVKPKSYFVENNKMVDNKIRMWELTNFKGNEDLLDLDVYYVTTLRNDYTQRIANHAFSHPARVGVDFVKIK